MTTGADIARSIANVRRSVIRPVLELTTTDTAHDLNQDDPAAVPWNITLQSQPLAFDHDPATDNDLITANRIGTWLVLCQIAYTATNTAAVIYSRIRKNRAGVGARGIGTPISSRNEQASVSAFALVPMAPGDVLTVVTARDGSFTGAVAVVPRLTSLSIVELA